MSSASSLYDVSIIDCSDRAFSATIYSIIQDSRKHNLIILEGITDGIVLSKFFKASVRCLASIGRGNVTKIMHTLPKKITNVLGIADKDYDSTRPYDGKIVYYDFNNFEMMLISDESVFNNDVFYSDGFSIEKKNRLISEKNRILEHLYPISILRLVNAGLIAKHFNVYDVVPELSLYDVQDQNLNNRCIQNNIINRMNSKFDSSEKTSILNEYILKYNLQINRLEVTRGHDFMDYFKIFLGLSSDNELYEKFSSAYNFEIFKKTNLYKDIKTCELNNFVEYLNF